MDFWNNLFHFISDFSWWFIFSTFWFFFFIEVPRYYILDFLVLVHVKLWKKTRMERCNKANTLLHLDNPLISIIVPGKGEGTHIYKLVISLREQTYKNFEIIVVDDGSTDNTPQICRNLQKHGYIDLFLRNELGGGKGSAANFALKYCKGKYVIHLDADSSLDRDAIEKILLPFYMDKRVKGVGGCVKVRNNENICTSLQSIEYLQTIQVGRTVTSVLGIYRVISGAFGAFEINMLHQVGGWDVGPGLDGDITQKIRKSKGKVRFAPDAICLTSVPDKFYRLIKQRMRWSKSLIRFRLRKHKNFLSFDENFDILNWISQIEGLVFNLFFDVLWVFYLVRLCTINDENLLEIIVLKFLITMPFSFLSILMGLWQTERKKEEWPLLVYVPIYSFYIGFFLRIVRTIAYVREFFFFSSYKDTWNPKKVSDMVRLDS